MKKSKGLFYAGIVGIIAVLAIAVVVITMGKRGGPGAVSAGGVTRITCYGGSEKEELANDPEVKKIFADKYGIEVNYIAKGSYKQVQIPPEELKADKIDCLWPSSASAQAIFEGSGASKAFGTAYQSASVLQSPEVLYANQEVAEGLVRAGIVAVRDGAYFIVDLKRLLQDYLLPGKSWADLGVTLPAGPILINSSDPATSNSSMTLAQLELATIASGNPYQPASAAQARAALGKVKALVDAQGLMRTGSDSAFEQWIIQQTGGLLAGYENQLLNWISSRNGGVAPTGIVTLYPEPTIFNDHPILSLSDAGRKLIPALEDDAVQNIAWTRYGFRSGTRVLEQVFPGLTVPPTHTIKKTQAPGYAVTRLLLDCFVNNQC
jgi:ABC-type Fe3+ transport system substrate-binding protein